MLCAELATIHGTNATRYGMTHSEGGQGGLYLTKLLHDQPDGEMAQAIDAVLSDLGWLGGTMAGESH